MLLILIKMNIIKKIKNALTSKRRPKRVFWISNYPVDLTDEERLLTYEFFEYLENNNAGFKWQRVHAPITRLKNNQVIYVQMLYTGILYNKNWQVPEYKDTMQGVSGYTSSIFMPKTIQEYRRIIYDQICNELLKKEGMYYIYHLKLHSVSHENSPNGEMGVMLRIARV
jgi:hypothetical protein